MHGAVTAAGGAWNASIVSEVVSYGSTTLTAASLGAYIADATAAGDAARTILGAAVMSLFVVGANHVEKFYEGERGKRVTVLRDMSFELREDEVVALLGRSGAGKSTFLRVLAGLVPATSGTVEYKGRLLTGPNPGVGFVFQTFALLPWLTVRQNVELGLQARGVAPKSRERAALEAIAAIGLDGFEDAYPKELSSGMRQRVGIARAMVLAPDMLFMDEPFSALDVLTAESLRSEVIDLVERGKGCRHSRRRGRARSHGHLQSHGALRAYRCCG